MSDDLALDFVPIGCAGMAIAQVLDRESNGRGDADGEQGHRRQKIPRVVELIGR